MSPLGPHEERVRAAAAARLHTYRQIGDAADGVLTPLGGPALLGASRWPSPPRWRAIERSGRTAVASDALSDPWDDEYGVGFGLEFWIETSSRVGVVVGSWLLSAISEVSYTAAGHGGVRPMIDEMGAVSVEVAGAAFPDHLRTSTGRVGVLLGVPTAEVPAWLSLPEGRARLVTITVLTPAELAHVVTHGKDARMQLARTLAIGDRFLSDPTRPSVI